MTTKLKDNYLKLATLSATYNIILQISLRIVTFIANAFILRHISRDLLGVINVRLLLLYTTLQFISREPFRRVGVSSAKSHEWSQVVNLLSLSIPLSLICGTFLSIVWYFLLERPEETIISDYGFGVIAVFVSVIIELIAEPLYVFAQINSYIKFKVITDGIFLLSRCLIMVSFVCKYPEKAVYVFSLAQIVSSLIYLSIYYLYFIFAQKIRLRDFFPKIIDNKPFFDGSLIILTLSFLKNTTLKQFLTEGERFVMTFFNTITFAEQGVFDVINNIGSLPARLVFQQIEESGFLLFSQKIDREKSSDNQNQNDLIQLSLILKNLLKIMILIGLVLFTFGYNYSELALLIYGGKPLSLGLGTNLLQWHCIYVVFIAINGVTECFTFAAMNSSQIDKFNKKMINISIFFLTSSYILTKLYGCKGFIMSNCLNMGSRIFISVNFITSYFQNTKSKSPLIGSTPHLLVLLSFMASFVALMISKELLCCETSLTHIFLFIIIGFICLSLNILVIYLKEKDLVKFSFNLFKSEKTKSS